MPAHNAAATLVAAVDSVRAQTFADWELLIADDASTDATLALTERAAAADPRIRPVQRAIQGGPAVARNDAIARACGRFVAFLDADDLWLPTKLEAQLEFAGAGRAPMTFTAYWRSSPGFAGALGDFHPAGPPVPAAPVVTYAKLQRANRIGCLTAMIDREITGDLRLPDVPGAEDFGLWLAAVRRCGAARGLDVPLAVYRLGRPDSMSRRRLAMARAVWRLMRHVEGLGRARSARNLATQVVHAIVA